jgi:hypothetical protein
MDMCRGLVFVTGGGGVNDEMVLLKYSTSLRHPDTLIVRICDVADRACAASLGGAKPKDKAIRDLILYGSVYALAADVDSIKADLRRIYNNSHVGYEGRIGLNCPYCEFVALNARDYYQHLADVETKHVLTGAVRNDVPYRGMAAMAEARLQNHYAIEERRRQDALKEVH